MAFSAAGVAPVSPYQCHREIGSLLGCDASKRRDALIRQGRVFDVDRAVDKTEPVQHPAHFRDVVTELDDCGYVGIAEPAG